jgi:hypothetical protein
VSELRARLAELEVERDRWMRSATTTCLACSEARERMHTAEDRLAAERKQTRENCVTLEEYDGAMARVRVQAEQIAALQEALKAVRNVIDANWFTVVPKDALVAALALAEGCAAPALEETR